MEGEAWPKKKFQKIIFGLFLKIFSPPMILDDEYADMESSPIISENCNFWESPNEKNLKQKNQIFQNFKNLDIWATIRGVEKGFYSY